MCADYTAHAPPLPQITPPRGPRARLKGFYFCTEKTESVNTQVCNQRRPPRALATSPPRHENVPAPVIILNTVFPLYGRVILITLSRSGKRRPDNEGG